LILKLEAAVASLHPRLSAQINYSNYTAEGGSLQMRRTVIQAKHTKQNPPASIKLHSIISNSALTVPDMLQKVNYVIMVRHKNTHKKPD